MELDIFHFNRKLDELKKIFNEIIGKLVSDQFYDHLLAQRYRELKKELLFQLISSSIHKSNTTYLSEVRTALKKLTTIDDPNIPDASNFHGPARELLEALKSDLQMNFTFQDYDTLVDEYLYSWFGPNEFIDNLLSIQFLFLKTDRYPREMNRFAIEIRSCYAFQQSTAACALCRTLLEIAVKDIYKKINFTYLNQPIFQKSMNT